MDVWFFLFHIGHLQANVAELQLVLSFILTASRVVRMTFQLTTSNKSYINKHYAVSPCLNNNNYYNSDNNFQRWHWGLATPAILLLSFVFNPQDLYYQNYF